MMFSRVLADEDVDIGRKLDKGNELLGNLPEIKETLGSFVFEQREHNQSMKDYLIKTDEHNLRLERTLEKLAEI